MPALLLIRSADFVALRNFMRSHICCCTVAINTLTSVYLHIYAHMYAVNGNIGDIWSRLIASFSTQTICKLSRKSWTNGRANKMTRADLDGEEFAFMMNVNFHICKNAHAQLKARLNRGISAKCSQALNHSILYMLEKCENNNMYIIKQIFP